MLIQSTGGYNGNTSTEQIRLKTTQSAVPHNIMTGIDNVHMCHVSNNLHSGRSYTGISWCIRILVCETKVDKTRISGNKQTK